MQEMLLQFIWQYSLYQPGNLATTAGEPVTVVHPGRRNTDAGPDFLDARIRIGNTLLAGHVELHRSGADWYRHGHHQDAAYRNVILHVLHQAGDSPGPMPLLPTLVLGPHIPEYIERQYTHLIQTQQPLPCAGHLNSISPLVKESWLSRVLAERWEQKLTEWQQQLQESAGNWQTLMYWRLAANFGFKVNAAPFLALARSLQLHILLKHSGNLLQLEALLFGQSGLLQGIRPEDADDDYVRALKREYHYLKHKYRLEPLHAAGWKFMRMRPANFPTIRLAQFAALLHCAPQIFKSFLHERDTGTLISQLEVAATGYWEDHFRFGPAHEKAAPRHLGRGSAENIIMNTIAPVRFLYGHMQGDARMQEEALHLPGALPPEDNQVMRLWAAHGWEPRHAADSQALLQLFRQYCSARRCLECSLGLHIVRSRPDK